MNRKHAYSKAELALMYFPDTSPSSAVKRLMAWVNRCQDLQGALRSAGYQPRGKMLTPRQVEIIVDFLGDP